MNLQDIPAKYRPQPFWSWNDKLDPEELRFQIREMHRAGLGGFFMHARGGLQTVYLSDEWMRCVEVSIDEADKLGMDAWLYDENGWPSGFGGGLVNGLGEEYQQKYLRCETGEVSELAGKERTIAFYTADGRRCYGSELPPELSGTVMRCYYDVNPCYVDNLDPAVVAEFIRVTHEHYYKQLPEKLRRRLRGIFTDEPQLSRNGIPWSNVLPREYQERYGRDLIAELPELFLTSERSSGVRVAFYKLTALLFADSFMRQVREWCDEHSWQLTGHHVLEERAQSQIPANGAIMPQYAFYHVPGIDHLGRRPASPVTVLQVVSSAMQYGQKQIMTESFALTGWACHFTGMRWIYQPQMARGVNFLCPHLESYSLRGLRKRDYPASCFIHQPHWDDHAVINGSFARIGRMLAEGKSRTDVLVVHPLSSVWKIYCGDSSCHELADFYNNTLLELTNQLDARLIPHHYADECIVDEIGSVKGKKISIGKQSYRCVLIPAVSNLSGKLCRMLQKFHAAGGAVAVVRNKEEVKLTIDGVYDPDAEAWFRTLPSFDSETAAAEFAASIQKERVFITENGIPVSSILCTWRDLRLGNRKGRIYYIVNTAYRCGAKLNILLPRTGKAVELIDADTGSSYRLSSRRKGRMLSVDLAVRPAGALTLFVTDKPDRDLPRAETADINERPVLAAIPPEFTLQSYSGNILTLDRCRYRVDGGEWEYCDTISLQARLLKLHRECRVELDFEFEVADGFSSFLEVAVETPDKFAFELNGVPFEAVETGWLFDKAFRRVALPDNIIPGKNHLRLSGRYFQRPELYDDIDKAKIFETEYNKLTYDSEIESIYLCGDFQVSHSGRVEPLHRRASRYDGTFTVGAPLIGQQLDIRDLCGEGLPFFAGNICLTGSFKLSRSEAQKVEYLRLKFKGANSCRVRINGVDAGKSFDETAVFSIASLVGNGINTLEIELTTSLRNMLGPHHAAAGELFSVNTMSFNIEANIIGTSPPATAAGYCFLDLGVDDIELC